MRRDNSNGGQIKRAGRDKVGTKGSSQKLWGLYPSAAMLVSSASPELAVLTDRCSLWIETVPAHGAIDLHALPQFEISRLRGFASMERRRQFALGRVAARRLVGQTVGEEPAAVDLRVGPDGAPQVRRGYLSIAHAGQGFGALGLAAFAAGPIGVDAEAIRPRHPGLARRILRPDESEVLDALGGPGVSSLTQVWALKEAVLKGQRTGLRAGAQSVRLVEIRADAVGGTATAVSERSGLWHLAFVRQRDLWLAVASQEAATGGR